MLANPPFNDSDWRGDPHPSPPPQAGEGQGGGYEDVPGFGRAATLDDIRHHHHILTPGRYVGAAEVEEDDEPLEEKMERLTAELREQQAEARRLDHSIAYNLAHLGFWQETS